MDQTRALGRMFGEIMNDLGYEAFYHDINNAVLDHYNSSSLSINNQSIELGQEAVSDKMKHSLILELEHGSHTLHQVITLHLYCMSIVEMMRIIRICPIFTGSISIIPVLGTLD